MFGVTKIGTFLTFSNVNNKSAVRSCITNAVSNITEFFPSGFFLRAKKYNVNNTIELTIILL